MCSYSVHVIFQFMSEVCTFSCQKFVPFLVKLIHFSMQIGVFFLFLFSLTKFKYVPAYLRIGSYPSMNPVSLILLLLFFFNLSSRARKQGEGVLISPYFYSTAFFYFQLMISLWCQLC